MAVLDNQMDTETVDHLTYLGSVVNCASDATANVTYRTGKAADVFQQMHHIWSTSAIMKVRLYNSIVIPTALCASQTWIK